MDTATREVLHDFIEKADELMSSSFTRFMAEKGQGVFFTFSPDEPIKIEQTAPDKESLSAYVLTFRLFILQGERISVIGNQPGMRQVIKDMGLSKRFREEVEKTIQKMAEYLDRPGPIPIVFMGHTATNREVMEKFIYGDRAHINNATKRAEFKVWRGIPSTLALYSQEFYGILYNLLFGIRNIQLLCQEELDPARQGMGTLALGLRRSVSRRRKST